MKDMDKIAAFLDAMQKDNISIDDLKSYKENKKKDEQDKALRQVYSALINYYKVCGYTNAEKVIDYSTFKKILSNTSIDKINFPNLFSSFIL